MPEGEVDWSRWRHAYGPADDLPRLLRAVASADADEASDALIEIAGRLHHQGSVSTSSSVAVPYMLDIVEKPGLQRVALLQLIGTMADPRTSHGDVEIDAVRQTIGRQAARVARLLDDELVGVRAAAAYTLGCVDSKKVVSAALAGRWRVETLPLVRAALVLAMHPMPVELEAVAVQDAEPLVRVAAALALVRAGRGLPDGAVEAVARSYDEDPDLAMGEPWCHQDVLIELAAEAPIGWSQRLLGLLLRARHSEVRERAIWALGECCERSRSATALLVPLLAVAITDGDQQVRSSAVMQAWMSGTSARVLADRLVDVADEYPAVAYGEWVTTAGFAIRALARLGDPRWLEPVAQALAAGRDVSMLGLHPGNHASSPEVLAEAVRIRDWHSGIPAVRRWFEGYLRSWYYAQPWAPEDETLTGDVGKLGDLLARRPTTVAAAAALWRLGTPVDDLAIPLVDALDPFNGPAVLGLLTEMQAVQAIPRLKQLAEQDQRITGPIVERSSLIWDDELLRDQIVATIVALEGRSTAR